MNIHQDLAIIFGVFLVLAVFCIALIVDNNYFLDRTEWQCTAQVRVGDTFPAKYECTQYTQTDLPTKNNENR
jgi:hypothetical protein